MLQTVQFSDTRQNQAKELFGKVVSGMDGKKWLVRAGRICENRVVTERELRSFMYNM